MRARNEPDRSKDQTAGPARAGQGAAASDRRGGETARGTRIGPLTIGDKVSNVFLARTDAARSIGWGPQVRRFDHTDFFTRAKGRLVSACNPAMQVLNVKGPFATDYLRFRFDIAPNPA